MSEEARIVMGTSIGMAIFAMRLSMQLSFYREYFRQKQRNAGEDPDLYMQSKLGKFW